MNHEGQFLEDGRLARPWRVYGSGPVSWRSAAVRPGQPAGHRWLCAAVCLICGLVGLSVFISPLLALVLGAGIVLFLLSLARPIVLGYLVIGAIALLSGTERGRIIPRLQPNEIVLFLSVCVVLLLTLGGKHCSFRISGYFVKAFAVLIGGTVFMPLVVYLLRGVELTLQNAFRFGASLQYFLLFWLFANLAEEEKDRHRLVNWMLACGSFVALVGILQALGVGFVIQLLEGWYPSEHEAVAAEAGRVTSLLGAWNSLGMFLMVNLLISWSILPERRKGGSRILLMAGMALCATCLVASGSYAGILGLVLGIFLTEALSNRKRRTAPLLVLVFVVISVFLLYGAVLEPLVGKRLAYQSQDGGIIPHTLLYRVVVWREIFIPAIIQHFPWPVYPSVPDSYAWGYEESQYVLLLFRTGLTGLLGFLAWVAITVSWLNRLRHQDSGFTRMISTAAMTILIVLAISGFTNEVFSFSGSVDYLWIMLGLVANSREVL